MITERETFTAVLFGQPLLRADAIICLAGEDGEERLKYAGGMMKRGDARYVVISGGVDAPPRRVSAKTLYPKLLGMGISHDRIVLEEQSTNTREQAVNVIAHAQVSQWQRLIIVASGYHLPRAFLSFVKALQEVGQDEAIQVMGVSASQLPWFKSPKGVERTRAQLYAGELGKVALYSEHVATYADGLKYLEHFEGR